MVGARVNIYDSKVWGEKVLSFHCPGCKEKHTVPISGPNAWGFNNNQDFPTITPSFIRIATIKCHSVLIDGSIKFFDDCDHSLAGKTVEVPEFNDN